MALTSSVGSQLHEYSSQVKKRPIRAAFVISVGDSCNKVVILSVKPKQ